MNIYAVIADHKLAYLMPAPNIQAASQFVKHWRPGVKVARVSDPRVLSSLLGHAVDHKTVAKSLARHLRSPVQIPFYTTEELRCLLSGINTG